MLSTTLAVKTQTTKNIKKTSFCLAYEEIDQIIKMILTATHHNKVDFEKLLIVFSHILDPRSQRAGSYKIGAVIVNV